MKRSAPPDIKALKQFVRAMEPLDDQTRIAAVAYLADLYLGIRLYGQHKWTPKKPEPIDITPADEPKAD